MAALAIGYGANEEQVLAALLHDAIEDGGSAYAAVIRYGLGAPVLQLVEALSDASAEHEAALTDATQRLDDWHQRKRAYLARLVDEDARVLLVSACDKLHNLRAIRADLAAHGLATFARFTAARAETLWYYAALADVLCPRLAATHAALATVLRAEVDALHAEVARMVDADGGRGWWRARRQGRVRIDYLPSAEALRILRECACGMPSATIDERIRAADQPPWRRLPVR